MNLSTAAVIVTGFVAFGILPGTSQAAMSDDEAKIRALVRGPTCGKPQPFLVVGAERFLGHAKARLGLLAIMREDPEADWLNNGWYHSDGPLQSRQLREPLRSAHRQCGALARIVPS
jgi:hypothetical protein